MPFFFKKSYVYYIETLQKSFGVSILFIFLKYSLMLSKTAFIWPKITPVFILIGWFAAQERFIIKAENSCDA